MNEVHRRRDGLQYFFILGLIAQSSWSLGSPGGLPPEAPTDPSRTLSRHTAPVIQPLPVHRANGQASPRAAASASEDRDWSDAFALDDRASGSARRSALDSGN
jgi:hypothetical protein